jgi:hypothetical protein
LENILVFVHFFGDFVLKFVKNGASFRFPSLIDFDDVCALFFRVAAVFCADTVDEKSSGFVPVAFVVPHHTA